MAPAATSKGDLRREHEELLNLRALPRSGCAEQDNEKRLRWASETQRPRRAPARQGRRDVSRPRSDRYPRALRVQARSLRKDLRRRANIVNWIGAMEGRRPAVDLLAILAKEAFRTNQTELMVQQFNRGDLWAQADRGILRGLEDRLLKNKQQRDLLALTATLVRVRSRTTSSARSRRRRGTVGRAKRAATPGRVTPAIGSSPRCSASSIGGPTAGRCGTRSMRPLNDAAPARRRCRPPPHRRCT